MSTTPFLYRETTFYSDGKKVHEVVVVYVNAQSLKNPVHPGFPLGGAAAAEAAYAGFEDRWLIQAVGGGLEITPSADGHPRPANLKPPKGWRKLQGDREIIEAKYAEHQDTIQRIEAARKAHYDQEHRLLGKKHRIRATAEVATEKEA